MNILIVVLAIYVTAHLSWVGFKKGINTGKRMEERFLPKTTTPMGWWKYRYDKMMLSIRSFFSKKARYMKVEISKQPQSPISETTKSFLASEHYESSESVRQFVATLFRMKRMKGYKVLTSRQEPVKDSELFQFQERMNKLEEAEAEAVLSKAFLEKNAREGYYHYKEEKAERKESVNEALVEDSESEVEPEERQRPLDTKAKYFKQ